MFTSARTNRIVLRDPGTQHNQHLTPVMRPFTCLLILLLYRMVSDVGSLDNMLAIKEKLKVCAWTSVYVSCDCACDYVFIVVSVLMHVRSTPHIFPHFCLGSVRISTGTQRTCGQSPGYSR